MMHWKNILLAVAIFAVGYYVGKNMETSGAHAAIASKMPGGGMNAG